MNKLYPIFSRFQRRDREASALERRVEGLEVQVAELTAKLNEAEAPRKRLEKENSVRIMIAKLLTLFSHLLVITSVVKFYCTLMAWTVRL